MVDWYFGVYALHTFPVFCNEQGLILLSEKPGCFHYLILDSQVICERFKKQKK